MIQFLSHNKKKNNCTKLHALMFFAPLCINSFTPSGLMPVLGDWRIIAARRHGGQPSERQEAHQRAVRRCGRKVELAPTSQDVPGGLHHLHGSGRGAGSDPQRHSPPQKDFRRRRAEARAASKRAAERCPEEIKWAPHFSSEELFFLVVRERKAVGSCLAHLQLPLTISYQDVTQGRQNTDFLDLNLNHFPIFRFYAVQSCSPKSRQKHDDQITIKL